MANMKVDDSEIRKLVKDFNATKIDMKKYNKLINRRLPKKMIQILKKHTPKDTGETAESWISQKTSSGFVISNDRGAIIEFLQEGTKPHVIKPKDKSVLFFEKGGSKIFAKFVNHPGYSPQMKESVILAQILEALEKETDRIITKILKDNLK